MNPTKIYSNQSHAASPIVWWGSCISELTKKLSLLGVCLMLISKKKKSQGYLELYNKMPLWGDVKGLLDVEFEQSLGSCLELDVQK